MTWELFFVIVLALYCGIAMAVIVREIREKAASISSRLAQQDAHLTEMLRISRHEGLPPRKPPTSVPPRRRSYDERAAEYEFQHGPNKPPNVVEQAGIDALRSAQETNE
jgi:hypothetical protein